MIQRSAIRSSDCIDRYNRFIKFLFCVRPMYPSVLSCDYFIERACVLALKLQFFLLIYRSILCRLYRFISAKNICEGFFHCFNEKKFVVSIQLDRCNVVRYRFEYCCQPLTIHTVYNVGRPT